MLRSFSNALLFAAIFACVSPAAAAATPPVAKEIASARNKLPTVTDFRNRDVEKFITQTENALVDWERWSAKARLSGSDQPAVDATTVEVL
jgi:hypothetical protein